MVDYRRSAAFTGHEDNVYRLYGSGQRMEREGTQ